MRVLAPAKVNLYLRITGRRADGYHLLDSVMVPISLCDELEITVENQPERVAEGKPQILVTCDEPTLPTDETNLAYRAAALFCKEAEVSPKILIALRKSIPFGAGLGGGSSDAAAVLKSLNQLFSRRFSEQQLCALAVRLGADVPFFIPCQPARVEGIGEILTSISPLPPRWLVLVVPPFGVSTPWAYHQFDELPTRTEQVSAELQQFAHGQWPPLSCLVNDLERAVVPTYTAIRDIKEQLVYAGADGALMSGSGSSVFGIFSGEEMAEHAVVSLKERGKTFLVKPLTGPPRANQIVPQ
jgi:4-diphosphocytidyl-2-C-methyl-D-erythritol kinase